MPAGRGRRRRSGGGGRLRRIKRIIMAISSMSGGGRKGVYRQQTEPVRRSRPIPGGCIRCTAMCGNGALTPGMTAIKMRQPTVPPGRQGTPPGPLFAAARGSAQPERACVPRTAAAGSTATTGGIAVGFSRLPDASSPLGMGAFLPHTPLHPYPLPSAVVRMRGAATGENHGGMGAEPPSTAGWAARRPIAATPAYRPETKTRSAAPKSSSPTAHCRGGPAPPPRRRRRAG